MALTNFVATFIVVDETELILTPFDCDHPPAICHSTVFFKHPLLATILMVMVMMI